MPDDDFDPMRQLGPFVMMYGVAPTQMPHPPSPNTTPDLSETLSRYLSDPRAPTRDEFTALTERVAQLERMLKKEVAAPTMPAVTLESIAKQLETLGEIMGRYFQANVPKPSRSKRRTRK